ncbi:hypothetical protein A2716_02825 [candidate division WWE3 bacterium RIFCSPHIGHO2_01_FULL_40_23]|uniref:Membrane insertase YidC/Oxa/ALB C-terminal domain-containing protein n=1 Tax=candidate division WWE3 bacterium RIFCSPLOWO2_01_FULL_41_18 TaxID=1802625 RepID=A0A1F4VFL9_UNCKA|nr:MAG: hypothetical protein A2716_02825 [candidate division WWE3 bacterium RIFCSPHIGHO2_01_FULL_40_23]OGC55919.1 MAG: hypothetical protein A3A78_02675 [candidate division WWE3 bacterium RIFCSPLOWO2_01_FULL_41_18]
MIKALGYVWNLLLVSPLLNLVVFFYKIFDFNMGLAIIAVSILVKLVTLPFTHSSLKVMQKHKDLMPELEKLKKKYGHDKTRLAEEQLKLYKDMGINPASGCLTQIVPILMIIALFSVINIFFGNHSSSLEAINTLIYLDFLKIPQGSSINPGFLYLNLSKPDPFFILPVLSALLQFLTSKMMMPTLSEAEKLAKKADDVKDDVMYNMQEQMLYTAPIIFLIVGLKLPSGVVLNIFVTTLFSLIQQYFVSGLGGLKPLLGKFGIKT